jgi:hypothetical protein
MKGALQMDYIIAAGIFLLVLALVTQYILSYYSSIGEYSEVLSKSGDAQNLLNVNDWDFVPQAWPETSADSSTVLLMHLNNQSGENATFFRDFSGKGNNGTCTGTSCPMYNSSGRFNSAYKFDGVNDYIEVSNSPSLNPAQITMEMWVKFNTIPYTNQIALNKEGQYRLIAYDVNPTHLSIRYTTTTTDWSAGTLVGNTTLQAGVWYHAAATYNGTKWRLYLNGNLDNEKNESGNLTIFYGYQNLYIGSLQTSEYPFNGTIDEVVIYNRSLSAEEIYEKYNYGLVLRRIGIRTNAYRFLILVNNTNPFYYNQSLDATDLTSELVSFDYTLLGYTGSDYKSTKIYDSNNNPVSYQINGTTISFATNIVANESKLFTVYFDDDSSFEDGSVAVTGSNYINETLYPIERIDLVQYEKIYALGNADYSAVRNGTNTTNNFRIRIQDYGTGSYILTFGDNPPRSGDVIALQKYIVFQNITGGIRSGKLIVQVW